MVSLRLPRWLSGKESTCQAGELVQSLGQEDPLEKEITAHSNILVLEMPWTEKPGGLQSMGLPRVRHNLATKEQQNGISHTSLPLNTSLLLVFIFYLFFFFLVFKIIVLKTVYSGEIYDIIK